MCDRRNDGATLALPPSYKVQLSLPREPVHSLRLCDPNKHGTHGNNTETVTEKAPDLLRTDQYVKCATEIEEASEGVVDRRACDCPLKWLRRNHTRLFDVLLRQPDAADYRTSVRISFST
jgi:hypothetical protein